MTMPIMGIVRGNECPACGEEAELEGEFFEGQEVDCACGRVLAIATIEATYRIQLQVVGEQTCPACHHPDHPETGCSHTEPGPVEGASNSCDCESREPKAVST